MLFAFAIELWMTWISGIKRTSSSKQSWMSSKWLSRILQASALFYKTGTLNRELGVRAQIGYLIEILLTTQQEPSLSVSFSCHVKMNPNFK